VTTIKSISSWVETAAAFAKAITNLANSSLDSFPSLYLVSKAKKMKEKKAAKKKRKKAKSA
jgi:hypothetical protein